MRIKSLHDVIIQLMYIRFVSYVQYTIYNCFTIYSCIAIIESNIYMRVLILLFFIFLTSIGEMYDLNLFIYLSETSLI